LRHGGQGARLESRRRRICACGHDLTDNAKAEWSIA